jgi:hypothetical protein
MTDHMLAELAALKAHKAQIECLEHAQTDFLRAQEANGRGATVLASFAQPALVMNTLEHAHRARHKSVLSGC